MACSIALTAVSEMMQQTILTVIRSVDITRVPHSLFTASLNFRSVLIVTPTTRTSSCVWTLTVTDVMIAV